MNKLSYFKRFTLALIFAMVGVISWGQSSSLTSGDGTEANPYIISSIDEWNAFAADVTGGYSYEGKFVKLTTDEVVVTKEHVVGYYYNSKPFKGTFDGGYNTNSVHTITFNGEDEDGLAPFNYIYGATIKNLKVTGSIVAAGGYASGLIYYNEAETNIENVTVSVNITSDGQEYCGGFVISNANSYYYDENHEQVYVEGIMSFSNCVYNGKILAGGSSAGFVASYGSASASGNGTATFTNCIFNPHADSSISGGENFGDGTVNAATCYYTMQIGTSEQGTRVYKTSASAPSDIIVKPWEILGENVYGPVTVTTTAEETYLFNSEADYYSKVTDCDVTFDGVDVEKGTHYTVIVKKDNETVIVVTAAGEYSLIITATGTGNYHGSYTKTFYVVSELTGEGTLENPFKIRSSADWLVFANHVNNGDTYTDAEQHVKNYSEAYYKLTNDITVSTMVGTEAHPFKGHFSGREGTSYNLNTLTFNYGSKETPTEDEIVAPFRYTDGATIEYLKVSGAIHTNVGKEAGLIGVNQSTKTTVQFIINTVNFYCYEALWYAEGGSFAYDGKNIDFKSSAYQGEISASNYHGGFCGNGNSTTTFTDCLFNPRGGTYWAENFVYNKTGDIDFTTCYYTEGDNQEVSEQGTLVYVGEVPDEAIGRKITTLYGQAIYVPVEVVIGNVSNTYIYTGNKITVQPTVKFDDVDAIGNAYCDTIIEPRLVKEIGSYTFTVTGRDAGEGHIYSGKITKDFRVVNSSSEGWNWLQTALSGSASTIDLAENTVYTAGPSDAALTIDRTVTINLHGSTIDRGLYSEVDESGQPGGQVFRIGNGAIVTIKGPGIIKGGNNQAESSTEHAEFSDGGGIWNMGNLTLDNVTVEYNRCEKYTQDVSRTARGGGIYSGTNSTLIIKGCTITHNVAQGGGGGLYVEKAKKFSINENDQTKECIIQSNTSQDKGGGLRVDASGKDPAVIKKCNINSNTVSLHTNLSVSYGGGIHMDGGTLNMTDCEINNNNATRYGGGIYMMKGTINATNCNIKYNMSYDSNNKYTGYGGGVCIMGGTFNMDGGMVYGNSSNIEKGGGVFVNTNTKLTLTGRVFVTGNWKFDDTETDKKSTTNVYIVNKGDDGVVTIKSGFDPSSRVGVSKSDASGWNHVFTKDLYTNGGTISNFVSDFSNDYTITRSSGEAKFSNPTAWNPTSESDYTINDTWIVNKTINAEYQIKFGEDGCLIIVENGVLTADITNTDSNKIVLNGGQLITSSTGVSATAIKNVLGAMSYQNWYVISSPFNNPTITMGPTSGTNLVTHDGNGVDEYDLYRFNESTTATNTQGLLLYWENHRNQKYHDSDTTDNFDNLKNGRGYLYRNENNYTAVTRGVLNIGDITYSLSYTETQPALEQTTFPGFHLIGNPYSHNIYKNDVEKTGEGLPAINDGNLAVGYYRLVQGTGTDSDRWVATLGYENPIRPMEGVLVQATSAHSLTIKNTTNAAAEYVEPSSKSRSGYESIMFKVANKNSSDVAYAMFCGGHGLNKIEQLNEQTPMLYIKHNKKDYAIATMSDETKAFNLNFEAKTTGFYTLSMKAEGLFEYLHLIDLVANRDIDMLQAGEYTFVGSSSDNANRFLVRLSPLTGSGTEAFAWQSGNDIIVNGEGTLEIYDVMGRMVASQHVSGVQTIEKPSQTGVYIFRLEGKAQKMVVR